MRVMRLRTPFSETATVRFRYRSAGRGGEFAIATVSRGHCRWLADGVVCGWMGRACLGSHKLG